MSLKRKLTFLAVVVAVAASAAGAYAATQTSPATGRQAFLSDVARRLHVTPEKLHQALEGAVADQLAAAVKAGRLTKAQAAAIQKRLSAGHLVPFGGVGRFAPPGAGFGPGVQVLPGMAPPGVVLPPGLRARQKAWLGHLHGRLHIHPWAGPGWFAYPPGTAVRPGAVPAPTFLPFGLLMPSAVRAALGYLGLTPARLRSEVRSGSSLADLARAHGKTAAGLESAVLSAVSSQLNRLVRAKHLTTGEAKRIESMLKARVAVLIHRPLFGLMMALPFTGAGRPGIWMAPVPRGRAKLQRVPAGAPAAFSGA